MNRKYNYHLALGASNVCEALSLHPEWHVISITCTERSEIMSCGSRPRFMIFYYVDQLDELDLIEQL